MAEEASYHRRWQPPSRATAAAAELAGLNGPQQAAVTHGEGPLLVLAGAGSGKTRVIIARIARLLATGTAPDTILGVTFTNKAARQMRQRLTALVGRPARGVMLSTFHALGLYILKQEVGAAGLRPGFCIYDTGDQLSVVRELMRRVRVADRRLDAGRVLDLILAAKRQRHPEVRLDWGDDYELAAHALYPNYLRQMAAFNAIDFDDLLLRTQDVLTQPEVRGRWEGRFAHLLVDEYQDTSADQLALVRALAGPQQNVCAVGDDDQAIYAWRGAAVDNILNFSAHFTGAREVILDQNYRSTGNILAAANEVICGNPGRRPKRLWSGDGAGKPVDIVACADDDDEADFVVDRVLKLLAAGAAHGEVAVLYRSNLQSRPFEEALGLANVPCRVVGGQAFFDRKEVRDVLAYLSVLHNPRDEIALRRVINVPPRGVGPGSVERLVAHAEAHGQTLWEAIGEPARVAGLGAAAGRGLTDLMAILRPAAAALPHAPAGSLGPQVGALIERLGLRDAVVAAEDAPKMAARRLENLAAVQASVARAEARAAADEAPLAAFLRGAALQPSGDDDDGTPQAVTLMTLHSAKGLEFSYVFLVGAEEDLLPHRRSLEAGGELSEERRLCYVGMTRARRRLWVSWARQRRRHGKLVERSISRFVAGLEAGPGLRHRDREAAPPAAISEARGADFFARMRAQLGMEA